MNARGRARGDGGWSGLVDGGHGGGVWWRWWCG